MNRITVSVTEEMEQAMRREARRRGCSVSALVRAGMGEHLHMVIEPDQRREIGFAALGQSNQPSVAERAAEILAEEWGDPYFDRDR